MDERLNGVRADLALRIAALDSATTTGVLASSLDAVRRIAHANGMFPAVTVTHALEAALARGERGPLIRGWLEILRDAVRSEHSDAATCDTYAAACSIRYS